MSALIELKTRDNTVVVLRKDQIAAIEEIGTTSRVEPYLKLYVAGYSFSVNMQKDEFLKLLGEAPDPSS